MLSADSVPCAVFRTRDQFENTVTYSCATGYAGFARKSSCSPDLVKCLKSGDGQVLHRRSAFLARTPEAEARACKRLGLGSFWHPARFWQYSMSPIGPR